MRGTALRQRSRQLAVVAMCCLPAIACGRPPDAPHLEPVLLWHGGPGFELLLESRTLAPPPSFAGNRFLTGWRAWRTGPRRGAIAQAEPANDEPTSHPRGGLVYAPFRSPVRFEIVNLSEARERALVLDLADAPATGWAGTAQAFVAGHALGDFVLEDPLRIPLPTDLPLGRVVVEVTLPDGVAVRGAGLSSALPPGEAHLEGSDLVQQGDSLLELYARIPQHTAQTGPRRDGEPSRLVGQFLPPAGAPAATFSLTVTDRAGRDTARVIWTPPSPNRAIDLDLPLPVGAIRVRLLARGAGVTGRWRALRVVTPAIPPAGRGPTTLPPPAATPTAVGAATPTQPPGLIIVVVLDALRADAVAHLGASRLATAGTAFPGRTPTLDRMAREGLAFTAHRSVAPNTLPSTKSLFTGRVWRAGGGLSLPRDVPTLAELIRAAGYRTACVSGNQNVSPTFAMTRGFDFDAPGVKFPPPRSERSSFNDNAHRARLAATDWIQKLGPEQRGFIYVHVIHPHNPYDPPPDLVAQLTKGLPSRIDGATDTLRALDRGDRETTAADRARLRALYSGSLAYADAELGQLIADATRGREPGDVLVAVTADHGEELFDHGGLLHGYTLYEEMLRIPLVLWSPGRISPGRVEAPTDTLDLFATLLAAAGAQTPPDNAGGSLLEGPLAGRDEPRFAAASAVRGGIYGARWGRWKVVLAPRTGLQWGMGSGVGRVRDAELVFDLEADPGETHNLAGIMNVEVAWLRAELLEWIAAGSHAETGDEPILDAEERGRLKALGYVGN